jgi:hypothetical protein
MATMTAIQVIQFPDVVGSRVHEVIKCAVVVRAKRARTPAEAKDDDALQEATNDFVRRREADAGQN